MGWGIWWLWCCCRLRMAMRSDVWWGEGCGGRWCRGWFRWGWRGDDDDNDGGGGGVGCGGEEGSGVAVGWTPWLVRGVEGQRIGS
ncbi:hypothetical protein Tco_0911423 [Tanacetum coccineum]|uniref:Secreted protein n=1 Tax=Tanacetum coccineum TaxID=301880 RepID=A0ABQ5CWQ7_9ASTR